MRRRYVYIQGVAHEVSQDWTPEPRADIHVMPDIQPYKSMIDGSEITSRSRHREHLRQHGCIEVGNDSSVLKPQYRPPTPPKGLKDHIIRATNQIMERDRRR